jgi:hypothetical protein
VSPRPLIIQHPYHPGESTGRVTTLKSSDVIVFFSLFMKIADALQGERWGRCAGTHVKEVR